MVMVLPKVSISGLLGRLKGQSSINKFHQFWCLKKKPYWGNHFWGKGYCVATVGLHADMICKCVRYQEKNEQEIEQHRLFD
jgi:putative transposase